MYCFAAVSLARADDVLRAIPELAKQAEAEKLIKEVFKAEYAKTSPPEHAAFAKKLLVQANETREDAAARFVLLRESRDLAAGAGDIKTALRAVDELAKAYAINAPAYRSAAINLAAKYVETPQHAVALIDACVTSIREDVLAEDYVAAIRLAPLMSTAAIRTENRFIVSGVKTYVSELRDAQGEFTRIKTIMNRTRHEDPANDLATGKYVCFFKNDWPRGAAMLVKSNDIHLKAAAEKELERPTTTAAQLQAASVWWELAQKQNGAAKKMYQTRARYWYQQAFEHLTGLDKALAEKRIAQSFGAPDDASVFAGHCYSYSTETMRWHEAKLCCELLGGHLACIETREENPFIVQFAHRRQSWLGATDEAMEGEWKWINGSPFRFAAWGPGQPDNTAGVENWLHIFENGAWNDTTVGPHGGIGFICEWE
jgi:hypothetical protein